VNWRLRQAELFFQRAFFHFSRNFEYAAHSLRWHYALLELEWLKPRYGRDFRDPFAAESAEQIHPGDIHCGAE
jgi:hypothetical protein